MTRLRSLEKGSTSIPTELRRASRASRLTVPLPAKGSQHPLPLPGILANEPAGQLGEELGGIGVKAVGQGRLVVADEQEPLSLFRLQVNGYVAI